MRKLCLIIILFICAVSCKKELVVPPPNHYASLEGAYTGVRYYWSRAFDLNFNVVESFDTIHNIIEPLRIDEDSNIIRFGGMEYKEHDDLKNIKNQDTIKALRNYSKPFRYITIIKSKKSVYVHENFSAPMGPSAHDLEEIFTKK
jgi:hypothetical protein